MDDPQPPEPDPILQTRLDPHRERESERIDALQTRVRILEHDLATLRDDLSAEVRTRKIVVIEADGFERIVMATRGHHGLLAVHGRTTHPTSSTCVELVAVDPTDGDGPSIGLVLLDQGDIVAAVEVLEGQLPHIWHDVTPPAS